MSKSCFSILTCLFYSCCMAFEHVDLMFLIFDMPDLPVEMVIEHVDLDFCGIDMPEKIVALVIEHVDLLVMNFDMLSTTSNAVSSQSIENPHPMQLFEPNWRVVHRMRIL